MLKIIAITETQDNVPLPPSRAHKKSAMTMRLESLQMGQSFYVIVDEKDQMKAAHSIKNSAKKLGIRVATRNSEGRVGVWRIA